MFYTFIDLVWKNVGGHRRYFDRVLDRLTWRDSCDGSEWTRLFRVTINIVRATRRTLSRSKKKTERDFCERRGAASERRVGRKERKWGEGGAKQKDKGREEH